MNNVSSLPYDPESICALCYPSPCSCPNYAVSRTIPPMALCPWHPATLLLATNGEEGYCPRCISMDDAGFGISVRA